jgi:hypothetical protein
LIEIGPQETGIDLERGRPGHPQDKGAHERVTLKNKSVTHVLNQVLPMP